MNCCAQHAPSLPSHGLCAPPVLLLGELWSPLPFVVWGFFAAAASLTLLLLPETCAIASLETLDDLRLARSTVQPRGDSCWQLLAFDNCVCACELCVNDPHERAETDQSPSYLSAHLGRRDGIHLCACCKEFIKGNKNQLHSY